MIGVRMWRFAQACLYWVQDKPLLTRLSGLLKKWSNTVVQLSIKQWRRFSERMIPVAKEAPVSRLQWVICSWIIGMIVLNYLAETPFLNTFWADHWPGLHEQHVEQLLARIPPDASIAASSNMNPHVSERQHLAVFPAFSDTSHNTPDTVQYIVVDLNALAPEDRITTDNLINYLTHSGQYVEIARAEGVVLLMRNPAHP